MAFVVGIRDVIFTDQIHLMKYLYLLTLCACVSLAACKKSKFIVNGIADVKIARDSFVMIPLEIEQERGSQERVTLMLSGLPANAEYSFSSVAGTPDFGSILTIKAKYNTIPGNYTVKLKGTNTAGYEKEYEMSVVINNNDACRVGLYGTWIYSANNNSSCGMLHNRIEISRDDVNKDGILIRHYFAENRMGSMKVNCNGTLSDQYYFGTFTDDMVTLSAQTFSGDTCHFKYIRP
jgi:hypothetical protein